MKKNFNLYFYGAIIIFVGIFLLFSQYLTFSVIKSTMGISLVISSLFAIFTALSQPRKQVQFAYHEMHALALALYGLYILFFCKNIDNLIHSSVYLFVFYTFSEIAFCIWIFNLGLKVLYKVVLIRVLLGFFAGIGSIRVMYFEPKDAIYALQCLGIIFIILGINIMQFVPIMKGKEMEKNVSKEV